MTVKELRALLDNLRVKMAQLKAAQIVLDRVYVKGEVPEGMTQEELEALYEVALVEAHEALRMLKRAREEV